MYIYFLFLELEDFLTSHSVLCRKWTVELSVGYAYVVPDLGLSCTAICYHLLHQRTNTLSELRGKVFSTVRVIGLVLGRWPHIEPTQYKNHSLPSNFLWCMLN